jgi:hypothetical protein
MYMWGSEDWYELVQDDVRWRHFVNTIMKLRVINQGIYWLAKWVKFQGKSFSMDLGYFLLDP